MEGRRGERAAGAEGGGGEGDAAEDPIVDDGRENPGYGVRLEYFTNPRVLSPEYLRSCLRCDPC